MCPHSSGAQKNGPTRDAASRTARRDATRPGACHRSLPPALRLHSWCSGIRSPSGCPPAPMSTTWPASHSSAGSMSCRQRLHTAWPDATSGASLARAAWSRAPRRRGGLLMGGYLQRGGRVDPRGGGAVLGGVGWAQVGGASQVGGRLAGVAWAGGQCSDESGRQERHSSGSAAVACELWSWCRGLSVGCQVPIMPEGRAGGEGSP